MKLRQLGSNQTEINIEGCLYLFSYETCVAFYDKDVNRWYRTSQKYSRTTTKHINSWLPDDVEVEVVPQEVLEITLRSV